jgi:hypothetical protein
MKGIGPFHPSFYYTHSLPDKPVIYPDSSPLPSQYIFAFISCAPINNPIKTAISSKPRFLSVYFGAMSRKIHQSQIDEASRQLEEFRLPNGSMGSPLPPGTESVSFPSGIQTHTDSGIKQHLRNLVIHEPPSADIHVISMTLATEQDAPPDEPPIGAIRVCTVRKKWANVRPDTDRSDPEQFSTWAPEGHFIRDLLFVKQRNLTRMVNPLVPKKSGPFFHEFGRLKSKAPRLRRIPPPLRMRFASGSQVAIDSGADPWSRAV